MKKLFALFLLAGSSFAQTEGVIHYEVKMDMHRRIKMQDESMMAMIPKTRTDKMLLYFNASESIYKAPEEEPEDNDINSTEGNRTVQVKFQRPKSELYRNYTADRKVELRDFMGKKFLIEDSVKVIPWKIQADTKQIKGYNCLKATYTNPAKQEVVAWFTEAIATAGGPAGYATLPGMILELDINNAETVYSVTQIESRAIRKGEITQPTGGKKVTSAEFKKIVDEKMQEMGGTGGEGMRMIIKQN